MGVKFKIAAMEPGFVKQKTMIVDEVKEDKKAEVHKYPRTTTESYKIPSSGKSSNSVIVHSQTCSHCNGQHLNDLPLKRCVHCGSFLPKGIIIG